MPLEFDDQDRAVIQDLVGRYPHPAAALLPVLHHAQDKFAHLSPEVQLLVAHALDIPPARVYEVVTFYEMFHEHKEGQFHIEVCTNISCHLMGGDAILNHLRSKLGIECGQTTEDGMFSLMEAECLASCGSGSMMKVGLDYYEYLTTEAVDAQLERFKKMAPELKGKPYLQARPEAHVGPVKGFEPKLPVIQPSKAPAKAAEPKKTDAPPAKKADAKAAAVPAPAKPEAPAPKDAVDRAQQEKQGEPQGLPADPVEAATKTAPKGTDTPAAPAHGSKDPDSKGSKDLPSFDAPRGKK